MPRRGMAQALGVGRTTAGRLLARARRRHGRWLLVAGVVPVLVLVGWLVLLESTVGVYEHTVTLDRRGGLVRETVRGPFGVRRWALPAALLVGPGLGTVLGAAAGVACRYALVDRKVRAGLRAGACLDCGYLLGAVDGAGGVLRCPECGRRQPRRPAGPVGSRWSVTDGGVSSGHDRA